MGITAHQLLDLEQAAPTRLLSRHNQRNHTEALFGGQVVGQALAAAAVTAGGHPAHSLHGYFLRAGAADLPVEYDVENLRDGRRFQARRVRASQAGRLIFDMHCSFHDPEPGADRQVEMPLDVPAAEGLPSLADYVRANADRLPPDIVANYGKPFPLELRLIDPERFFFDTRERWTREFWVRMRSAEGIEDPVRNQCLLAFLSDYWLAGVAITPLDRGRQFIASVDHAVWFHRPAGAGRWLLYRTDCPSMQGGRGLARGQIFTEEGILAASTAQEAVVRPR